MIVLLTISSLFLCGYVVQYVATADNYKQGLDKSNTDLRNIGRELEDKATQLQTAKDNFEALEKSKNEQISVLTAERNQLQEQIRVLELAKSELEGKVQSWVSIVDQLTKSNDEQRTMFENTFNDLNDTKSQLFSEQKKLDEVTSALLEKETLIDMLETQTKKLTQEKIDYESRLNRLLQPFGQKAQPVTTTLPRTDIAQQITPVTQIGINAKVTGVDMKSSMAKISVGSSDGVTRGMRFHISRGNEYICDVLIIDVAAEDSVGSLELVQQQPRIGDSASTNL